MDDDDMLEVLREALAPRAGDDVPEEPPERALAAAVAAGGWANLDDQLAILQADSADDPVPAGVRGTGTDVRQLTYVADDLTIECELAPDALLGQAVPAAGVSLELVGPDGTGRPLDMRPDGSFVVTPAPAGPVGIRCSRPGRPRAMTPWLLT